jgi:hypothetical protein
LITGNTTDVLENELRKRRRIEEKEKNQESISISVGRSWAAFFLLFSSASNTF